MNKKRIKILLVNFAIILALTSIGHSQSMGKRWMIIQDLQDKIVYIDTSAIKVIENQISVWSLVSNREPKIINPFQQLVSKIKTNFLINTVTNKYALIGTLYYDEKGRIVGESSAPKITGGNDNFMMPIQEGTLIDVIKQKSEEYLNTGGVTISPGNYEPPTTEASDITIEDVPANKDSSESDAVNETQYTDDSVQVAVQQPEFNKDGYPNNIDQNIPSIIIDEDSLGASTETDTAANSEPENAEPNNTQPESKPEVDKASEQIDNPEPKPDSNDNNSEYVYNAENDKNLSGIYFTDGEKICFQMSSFKTESVAEAQVEKYKRQGHNAFIVKAYLPSKRATYNRVRIGLFDTLAEAKQYRRKMK